MGLYRKIYCTFNTIEEEFLYIFKQSSDKKGVKQNEGVFVFVNFYYERQVNGGFLRALESLSGKKGGSTVIYKWKIKLILGYTKKV